MDHNGVMNIVFKSVVHMVQVVLLMHSILCKEVLQCGGQLVSAGLPFAFCHLLAGATQQQGIVESSSRGGGVVRLLEDMWQGNGRSLAPALPAAAKQSVGR